MLIHVAVPVPGLEVLTYRTAVDQPAPHVGARAVVPLGSRTVTGIVVAVGVAEDVRLDEARVKPVRQLLDAEAFVPSDVVDLAMWTADYYAAGPGETLAAVLPPKARGGRADAHKTRRVAAITAAGIEALGAGDAPVARGRALTAKQREALAALAAAPLGLGIVELGTRGIGGDTLARLAGHGLVSVRADRVERDPFEATPFAAAPVDDARRLTAEQHAALERLVELASLRAFRVALLHGVTGSGKTEIYLRLAARVRDSGRSVLVMVPEIALTPALTALFRQVFGERVAVQHSALSDGERHDQWQRIRAGAVDVVIGTRSAVFAPTPNLGLVIVDEEHDASYKQEESPRYHGRDVAIVRAQRANAVVVLGSATPSMESYANAMSGRYERVVLERRVLDRPLAAVTVVDMREEFAADGPDVVISRALREGIVDRLSRSEQVLVLLNRRGFATAVFCRQCAATIDCPNCSVSLVVHGEGAARRARCHYCNYSTRVPLTCGLCSGAFLEQTGFGTERVEAEIRAIVPTAQVARLDRDAIRRRGTLASTLSRFRSGEIQVLVGTQMIAKGHDFPQVTLVGVISADVGLGVADFRASERTFQLLTQVAGRAGRGEQPGEAIVQTLYPDHYSIQLACTQNYRDFFDREVRFRRAMRYPPVVSLVNVVVRARTFSRAFEDADGIAARLRSALSGAFRVLGPAPAPLGKLRGEFRVQLLVKGANRRGMREAVQAAVAAQPELARRTTIDVDPLTVL